MKIEAKKLNVGDVIIRSSKLMVKVISIENKTDKQISYTVQRIHPNVYPADGMGGFNYKSSLSTMLNIK